MKPNSLAWFMVILAATMVIMDHVSVLFDWIMGSIK